ncbi:Nif11-like leader peptide family natural product precursor [Synechococcus sp. UW179A]|uniref:Nif11-like leader peptide family natural product precursor n=1 Tax=Synechococcus sp. UW179A TaxID=2575510 RepID=UPI000E0E646B|nr:Nif11-like leader peptide family natural product precursor [Synechococcus sp. UW179A]
MSEEQLKAFQEKVKGDTSLQEKLKAAADADTVSAIAKEAGFSISADDLTKAQSREITDEELEGVAGGNLLNSWLVCEVRCRSVNGVGTNKWVRTNQ